MQFIKLSFWFLLFLVSSIYLTLYTNAGNSFIYFQIERYISDQMKYDMVITNMESNPGTLNINLKSREKSNVSATLTGDYSWFSGDFILLADKKYLEEGSKTLLHY